jgi:hypothetical protein
MGSDLVVGPAGWMRRWLQVLKLQKKPPRVARIGDISRDIDRRRLNGDSV